jgi:hypothetical protein
MDHASKRSGPSRSRQDSSNHDRWVNVTFRASGRGGLTSPARVSPGRLAGQVGSAQVVTSSHRLLGHPGVERQLGRCGALDAVESKNLQGLTVAGVDA